MTDSFIKEFRDLFKCRQDVFSIAFETPTGKMAYPPYRENGKDMPLLDEHIFKHLKGDILIGVYPLYDKDKTSWVALDFDGGEGFDEDPIDKAFEQQEAFEELGIISYVEISQSGKGAHLWIFLDEPLEARIIRTVVKRFVIDAETFDRMFPNQDSAESGYGNLIALPYQGERYKKGNSTFLSSLREPVNPRDFIKSVIRNKVSHIKRVYEDSHIEEDLPVPSESRSSSKHESLSGAIKVTSFCKWMKAAKERMHQQNQEPEFYALCCQFAQLQKGEDLAFQYGRLHPYSDERIKQKFEQAKKQNKPHTCQTLREQFNAECACDIDYGVQHCYELANLSFQQLMAAKESKVKTWSEMSVALINRTKKIYREGGRVGYAFGYDRLDDMTALRDGQLTVIGARTSVGKTSWAIDITANLNNAGVPAYWASMEMNSEELAMKYMGRQANVDSRSILEAKLDREDWKKILYYQKNNPDMPLYVDDQNKDIDKMIDTFADMIYTHGKGVIIVDYIEMIRALPGEGMTQLTSRASLELKGMARILDVPVIALSNFNRKAEADQFEGTEPMDSWLRNSGLLEQSADVILYLLGKRGKGTIKRTVHVQKERFTGMANEQITLWFEQAYSRFVTRRPDSEQGKIIVRTDDVRNNLDLI